MDIRLWTNCLEVVLTESLSCVSTVSYFFTSDDVHECSCKALWVATGQGKPEQIQLCVCVRENVCVPLSIRKIILILFGFWGGEPFLLSNKSPKIQVKLTLLQLYMYPGSFVLVQPFYPSLSEKEKQLHTTERRYLDIVRRFFCIVLPFIFYLQSHIWQWCLEPKGAERLWCERRTLSNTLFVVALSVDKIIYFIFKRSIKQSNNNLLLIYYLLQ